ncbi:MAG TPA: hypothetical protein PKW63_01530 [Vicinamibacterales bacterium]|nr:hypothetical protein [Vicinamibacterales bacterium]
MDAALKPLVMVTLRVICDHDEAMIRAVTDRLRFGDSISYRELGNTHNVSYRTLCDKYERFRREFSRACAAENVDPKQVIESRSERRRRMTANV